MIAMLPDAVLSFVDWIHGAGWVGVGTFALAFVVSTLAFVPASLLAAAAGFMFGPLWGTLLVSPLGVLSASLALLIGRSFARPWVLRRLEQRPRFVALDAAVGRNGFRIVFLLRLALVIPFAPLSYALGASRVRGYDFVLASWLGQVPSTVLYVYLGSLVTSVSQILSGRFSTGESVGRSFYGVGLAVSVVALVVIVRIARNALSHAIDEELEARGG